jgi:hypothetical protein
MSRIIRLPFLGLSFAIATAMLPPLAANACNGNGNCANASGHYRGVPGPIVGAGLPLLAVGYGVYWLIRRRQKAG